MCRHLLVARLPASMASRCTRAVISRTTKRCGSAHAASCCVREAIRQGLLDEGDVADDAGAQSEAASTAIEALLERTLVVPQPDEATCRRYYEQNNSRFRAGERVSLRHILFAVTPGVDV